MRSGFRSRSGVARAAWTRSCETSPGSPRCRDEQAALAELAGAGVGLRNDGAARRHAAGLSRRDRDAAARRPDRPAHRGGAGERLGALPGGRHRGVLVADHRRVRLSPSWIVALAIGALLYIHHAMAAIAAHVPVPARIPVSLLTAWLGRVGVVLVASVAVCLPITALAGAPSRFHRPWPSCFGARGSAGRRPPSDAARHEGALTREAAGHQMRRIIAIYSQLHVHRRSGPGPVVWC